MGALIFTGISHPPTHPPIHLSSHPSVYLIFAQKPKILPHRENIRRHIAELLALDINQVWIKAKTGEAVGPIGEEHAIAAECIVLLETQAAFNKT